MRGKSEMGPKDFEHLSKDIYDHLEPDEREYLKGDKTLQRNVMTQYRKIEPSVPETTNAMQAGAALGGWWKRYIDVFHGLAGEPELPKDVMWHGTPSGDLRGGTTGLHVGTKECSASSIRGSELVFAPTVKIGTELKNTAKLFLQEIKRLLN